MNLHFLKSASALKRLMFVMRHHGTNTVYVVSYPRSGNTMLMWTLANLLDAKRLTPTGAMSFIAPPAKPEELKLIKDHVVHRAYRKQRVVFVVRDGRDAMISLAYMTMKDKLHGYMRKDELADFIKWLDDKYRLGGWPSHMRRVGQLKTNPGKLVVRYEDLMATPQATQPVVDFVTNGKSPAFEDIVTAWNDRDVVFEHLKNNGKANELWGIGAEVSKDGLYYEWSQNRKGSTWRQSWDKAAKRAFHEAGATPYLLEYGYETDSDWWKH